MKLKYAIAVWCLLNASVVMAQPYLQWNTGGTNNFEGHFVYVDGNGTIRVEDITGVGGYIPLNRPQANGRMVLVVPTLITGWQTTGQGIKDPFNTSLNEQIGPTFVPTAQAQPSIAGENWPFYVKWHPASVADAQAKGIDDQLPFSIAVFSTAKRRTDGVPMKMVPAAQSNYADSSGSTLVTVPNVQYFDDVSTSSRIIFGGKAIVTGNGQTYTARLNAVVTTPPWSGPLDYVTYTVRWTFQ